MNLEWRLRAALWLLRRTGGGRRLHMMSPVEAHTAFRAQTIGTRARRLHGAPHAMAEIRDVSATGAEESIPIRLYRPPGALGDAIVFFHGGGFVMGGIEEADIECRRIAVVARRVVCSVGYRLAPEHPFPAAVNDAVGAFNWIADRSVELNIDRQHIAVGGESAGGTLAAVVAQLARDAGAPQIDRQLLIYAGFDASGRYPSRESSERPPILAPDDVDWSHRHYVNDPAEFGDPRASPLRGDLRGLPAAMIMVAEHDPLHDEGVAYANALQTAGCDVVLRQYPRQPHGFLLLGRLSGQSARAFDDIGQFLRV